MQMSLSSKWECDARTKTEGGRQSSIHDIYAPTQFEKYDEIIKPLDFCKCMYVGSVKSKIQALSPRSEHKSK